jgi:hypothetical protein
VIGKAGRLTAFSTHRAFPPFRRSLAFFITHRTPPPRLRFLALHDDGGGGLVVDDLGLSEGAGMMDVLIGLLVKRTPVPSAGSFFGKRLVEARAGDCQGEQGTVGLGSGGRRSSRRGYSHTRAILGESRRVDVSLGNRSVMVDGKTSHTTWMESSRSSLLEFVS